MPTTYEALEAENAELKRLLSRVEYMNNGATRKALALDLVHTIDQLDSIRADYEALKACNEKVRAQSVGRAHEIERLKHDKTTGYAIETDAYQREATKWKAVVVERDAEIERLKADKHRLMDELIKEHLPETAKSWEELLQKSFEREDMLKRALARIEELEASIVDEL